MAGRYLIVVVLSLLFSANIFAIDTDSDGYADSVDPFPLDAGKPATKIEVLRLFLGDGSRQMGQVALAGDINGDGINDYRIAGSVFSGSNDALLYTGAGSRVGDTNNDGYDDLITKDASGIRILSGNNQSVLLTIGGNFIYPPVYAGDINNDGNSDVMALNSGMLKVYSGANGALLYTLSITSYPYSDYEGTYQAAGDVNNDGYDDIAVIADGGMACNWEYGGDPCRLRVYSGQNGSILLDKAHSFYTPPLTDLAPAGDFNHDGFADVATIAFGEGPAISVQSAVDPLTSLFESDFSQGMSTSVTMVDAGDLSGDGYADLLFGTSGSPVSMGAAYIYSGFSHQKTILQKPVSCKNSNILLHPEPEPDGFGGSLAYLGDINGDSQPDFITTAPRCELTGAMGFVVIYTALRDTDADGTVDNTDTDDDNDGVLDINDKFPHDPTKSKFARHDTDTDGDSDVLVRSASTGTWTRYSIQNNAVVGSGVMNAPISADSLYIAQLDANGDGDADILTRSTSTGAWTLSIVADGAVTSSVPLYLYANLAYQFVGIGDFNNDGTDDVMLRHTTNGYRVFLLQNHAVSTSVFYNAWLAASSVDQGIGDFNGDGTDDLLVRRTSDNLYFIFKTINGEVNNYYCACNIWLNPHWTFQYAGDTNKDGIDDIVIRGTGASADGKWWAFRMNNFSSILTTNLNLFLNKTAVTVGAAGDYNGDGNIDVLTRVNNATTYVSPIVNGAVTGNYWLYNFTTDQVIGK